MARLPRVEYEGAIYHVTIRANSRILLFADDRDRTRFLESLEERAEDCSARVCLLPDA